MASWCNSEKEMLSCHHSTASAAIGTNDDTKRIFQDDGVSMSPKVAAQNDRGHYVYRI